VIFQRSTKKKWLYLSCLENLDVFKEGPLPNLCTGSILSKKVSTWIGSHFGFGKIMNLSTRYLKT
jgi:hypothetical protein